MTEEIKKVEDANLEEIEKKAHLDIIESETDSIEVEEGTAKAGASCPPHVWNKTVVPYKCIYCGLTPGQV